MKKILTALFVFCICKTSLWGQKPEDLLNQWSARTPIEKVYLHFDRENYLAGETAWFKAYLSSDYQPDTISTTLFVELLNGPASVISRLTLPVVLGSTNGQFELPDSLTTGNYIIRAYTATMLNPSPGLADHDGPFLYQRQLYIVGKKQPGANASKEKMLRLEFFPEGGNFVAGLTNSVAFKITNEYGLPENFNGIVENEKGEKVADLKSFHDGMGFFDMLPEAGSTYTAKLESGLPGARYPLPAHTSSGIVFRLVPDERGSFYEVFTKNSVDSRKPAYMIGQIQHHVVFKKELTGDKTEWSGIIDTRTANSGILQVTVFDKEDIPMAERLVFVDNKEYLQPATLSIDTVNFTGRTKNQFVLSFNDTISGNFSVSVTDADYAINETSRETIISGLLLTSDLKGYIHNPAYYFSSADDSVRNALDLVMMVNGWRRFRWSALQKEPLPAATFKDNGYITVSGKVTLKESKKLLTDYELMVLQTSADSTQSSFQMMQTDQDGRFRMDSMIFFDRTNFFVTDIKGKKSKWLDIHPDADSLRNRYPLPPVNAVLFGRRDISVNSGLWAKLAFDYDAIARENGKMLDEVTLKVRKKTPLQEVEEKYVSGLFSGMSQKTIDLVSTKERIYQRNIFEYIKGRVTGVDVVQSGLDYILYYRNNFSMRTGRTPMTLYLDEMQTDAAIISTIPADQIAMIKVYSSFVGAAGNGVGGVLAVYTKKGADMQTLRSSADNFSFKGYSVIREFYSPDYSVDAKVVKPDHRITLSWQPIILLDEVNAKLPVIFYNNDRTKRFKLIAEGMTWDGKMIHLEKLITPQ